MAERLAIPLPSNNTYSHHRQDVSNIVNASAFTSSPTSSTFSHLPKIRETKNVSSSKSPLIHNLISRSPRRPPTSNKLFSSSEDLAAYHGIPQFLPPAPRTVPSRLYATPSLSELFAMRSNYLKMLSQEPTDTMLQAFEIPGFFPQTVLPEIEANLSLARYFSQSGSSR